MQEAMLQIGTAILQGSDFVESLVKEAAVTDSKGRNQHVLKLNFDTTNERIIIDTNEEMNEATSKKYLYIGSAPGAASRQWYSTASNLSYHITETVVNLSNKNFKGDLGHKLAFMKEKFYIDFGEEFSSPKNRYILDLEKAGGKTVSAEAVLNEISDLQGSNQVDKAFKKKLGEKCKKLFIDYLNEIHKIKDKEISLYTILIDGVPLCDFPEYREAIRKEREVTKPNKTSVKHYCSGCGSSEDLTAEIQTDIKFYITDKITFFNDFNKANFGKSMMLCQNCIKKILAAEKYVMNHLNTRMAGFTLYIVPHFIVGSPMTSDELQRKTNQIIKSFNTVKSYESIKNLKIEIENSLTEANRDAYFLLNFIFYKKNQKATKVQKFIKDINPSMFNRILEAEYYTEEFGKSIYGEQFYYKIDLNSVYYLIPIRISDGQSTQYKRLLDRYEDILCGRNINKKAVIEDIIKCCKIKYFDEDGYNISKNSIESIIVNGELFIKFLQYLKCIKEGKAVDYSELNVNENLKLYMQEMKYTEQEAALFLLGYLIGEIGNSQRKRSVEGKKPILNKLNYAGIDRARLKSLSSQVLGKLDEEKIRVYYENVFGECRMLMDKHINSDWSCNKQENLYYILSGYGYAAIKHKLSIKKDGGNNDEK
ncbi:TIGR02556 family CRISPR-associated protein [Clostridium oryzae]|uniref:CRISPR-associated protein n=1 Tax=Clostridium oryzae TaxID=1450648 RepID=A0A1V4IQT2_9CLOT|nr:TIGR02556 family CRISPR-associated protein [Clostridium oryzae]OPJ62165.1 CRISPR-associated protein [Clostridium oryzae]